MKILKLSKKQFRKFTIPICVSFLFLLLLLGVLAQNESTSTQDKIPFEVGERLTYNISFEKYKNAAFAEISVVSKGKLEGKDAIELYAKLKSVDLLSAAFYLLDEERNTFASVETGLPLYIKKVSNASVIPRQKIENYLKNPTPNYDLLTLIYKIRNSNGVGTFLLNENDKVYNFTLQSIGSEKVKNDLGEFNSDIVSAQSSYLDELGISNLKINFSSDEKKIPLLISFTTAKGKFLAEIASIKVKEQNTSESPTPTPTATPTRTRTPVPTPTPYVDNQPLSTTLPFALGESLEFKITRGREDLGSVVLNAKERKKYIGKDSLLLTAKVKNAGTSGNPIFNLSDNIKAQVDPISLMPRYSEFQFTSDFRIFNQKTNYDQDKGIAVYNGSSRIEIPVGTHSLLSLAYAVRAFNLRPSRNPKNPVNDTRVAVFLGNKPFVFTLRPSKSELTNSDGEKIPAILINVKTGNRTIDRLNFKLWLSVDRKRLPLRLTFANYQADLVSQSILPPK